MNALQFKCHCNEGRLENGDLCRDCGGTGYRDVTEILQSKTHFGVKIPSKDDS